MGLRAFHLLFIAVSVVLAAFVAAWAAGACAELVADIAANAAANTTARVIVIPPAPSRDEVHDSSRRVRKQPSGL